MRVLILSKKFPYPVKDGESIGIDRTAATIKLQGHEVDLACINTLKHYANPRDIKVSETPFSNFYDIKLDTSIKPFSMILSLLKGGSYNLERFWSNDFNNLVTKLCSENNYDIIQLDGLFLYHYIKAARVNPTSKIILRAQNVEFEIWEKLAANEKNIFKKKLLHVLAARMKSIEIKVLNLIDGLVTVTNADADKFKSLGYRGAFHYLPIGMDAIKEETFFNDPLKLFHIGGMDWLPNIEGLEWFIENVWKTIYAKYPTLTFHLAGRNFSENLFRNIPGVIVHGEVNDADAFIAANDISIVPLLSGSGVRLKILEALRHGKVVISTSKGAEGIAYKNGINLLEANDAKTFVTTIEKCITDKNLLNSISVNAKKLIEREYDIQEAGNGLINFYDSL